MTVRMEKVRGLIEALDADALHANRTRPRCVAALAEVEEWETRLAFVQGERERNGRTAIENRDRAEAAEARQQTWEKRLEFLYQGGTMREMMERAEAAEAEADRLKAALEHLGHPNYGAKPTGRDAADMASYARAALAPADRDTA